MLELSCENATVGSKNTKLDMQNQCFFTYNFCIFLLRFFAHCQSFLIWVIYSDNPSFGLSEELWVIYLGYLFGLVIQISQRVDFMMIVLE